MLEPREVVPYISAQPLFFSEEETILLYGSTS